MPWWLLGVSMVATTFSTATPNLVTDLVRQNGVSGNWGWWAFLLTGMLTVFIYAKLWHRSNVLTDIEFYEIRYSMGSGTTAWFNTSPLVQVPRRKSNSVVVNALKPPFNLYIKAVDKLGNESANATLISSNVDTLQAY